jgi:WD40 repeat protein
MNRKQLQACRRRLYGRLPLLGGWLRRQAAWALIRENSVEAVRILAEAVARTDDERLRSLVREGLRRLPGPRHAEAVGALWLETRHPELTRLLGECSWLADAPLRVQVLYALQCGRLGLIEAAEARAVEALLHACADPDGEVARRAREVLANLKTPEGREALCRRAMQPEQELAREIAVGAGLAPREAGQRALFFFLTGQWDAYQALDFDQALLRAVYEGADEETRRRIAAKAREVGRVEWVAVVAGGRRKVRLAALTDAEWQVTADVLRARGQWAELWRLAQEAPAPWAARLLLLLKETGWRPRTPGDFDELARLAELWQAPDLPGLVRERAVLSGHTGPVTALAFTPDGRWLLSGGEDGTVRLWGLPEGRCLREIHAHPAGVTAVVTHPDGRQVVSGARDSTLREWELPELRPARTLREENHAALSLALSPDGRLLAAGLDNWMVCLWDLAEGVLRERVRGHGAAVSAVAISPDGRLLASASVDQTVRLWDLPDGRFRQMLLPGEWVTALAFGPDGRLLASAGYDRAVRLWRLPAGEAAGKLEGHAGDVTCLAMSPDGRVLVSSGQDRTVRLWGLPEGRCLRVLQVPTGILNCLAVSPDGRLLASCGKDRTVRLWDLRPVRLAHAPAAERNAQDLAWAEEALRDGGLRTAERGALEFLAALIRLRLRFEVEFGEGRGPIVAGEFDIEIAG